MTDHEPVNIMGVFAFPNPDRDTAVFTPACTQREIRWNIL